MDYNLLEEKWIPVLWKDGHSNRVGIIEALTQAGRIRQIAPSNPMDRLAILRFLLALLYWCNRNRPDKIPDDWFPSEWFKKLGDNRKCFNLLAKEKSFYQDHTAGGKAVAATNLLHDLPSGSNIAHFRHVQDFRDGLCLACCAMGLLRWASVASAGTAGAGQSMTAGVNGNTPAYSIRMGASLLETLWLSWPISVSVKGDAPLWEGASETSPLGVLKGMTWQSRSVLLAPADTDGNRVFSAGRCCYCGDPTDRLVKSILFRPGWHRPPKESWWDDPHLLRVSTKDGKGKEKNSVPKLPGPDDPLEDHAKVWQSVLRGLLQGSGGVRGGPAEFSTTLLGANQQLYKDVDARAVTMPALKPRMEQGLAHELEWLRQLIWRTTSARTIDWHKRPRGHAVIEALCSTAGKGHAIRSSLCAASPLAEKELEQTFAKLTQALGSADQNETDAEAKALEEWKEEVCRILRRSIEQVADLTTRGSPLRRREARDRASEAVLNAVRRKPMQKEGVKR